MDVVLKKRLLCIFSMYTQVRQVDQRRLMCIIM